MDYYNSVFKADLRGEIYRGMVFNFHMVKGGFMSSSGHSMNELGYFDKEENEKRAVRRAKMNIADYVKTNVDLKNFVTYTLDSNLIDRYDSKEVYGKIRNWLSDRVKRKGLKYILVPEQHKDKAWHFHGFTNVDLKWKYGFQAVNEVENLEDRDRRIKYMISYVKKNMIKFNGRYYLHSRNLEKPIKTYMELDFDEVEGKCIELSKSGAKMKIII